MLNFDLLIVYIYDLHECVPTGNLTETENDAGCLKG